MFRSAAGWVRVANEDWHSTMSRMKHRLQRYTYTLWPCGHLVSRQYNFGFQTLRIRNWAAAVVKGCPESNWQATSTWSPANEGDDRLRSFAASHFPAVNTWFIIAETANWPPAASQYKALQRYRPNRANTQARAHSPHPYRIVVQEQQEQSDACNA